MGSRPLIHFLVVGDVEFEEVESIFDGLREAELTDQELDGADAAGGDGSCPVGDVVVDIRILLVVSVMGFV